MLVGPKNRRSYPGPRVPQHAVPAGHRSRTVASYPTPLHSAAAPRHSLADAKGIFVGAYKEWTSDYNSLRGAWLEIPEKVSGGALKNERAKANSIGSQIDALCKISVIEWFSTPASCRDTAFPFTCRGSPYGSHGTASPGDQLLQTGIAWNGSRCWLWVNTFRARRSGGREDRRIKGHFETLDRSESG